MQQTAFLNPHGKLHAPSVSRPGIGLSRLLVAALLALNASYASSAVCEQAAKFPPEVRASRLVALGEVHGTTEAPAFAAKLVCTLATSDSAPVVMALEVPDDLQAGIDAYVNGGPEAVFAEHMKQSKFWTRSMQDGRSSIAMLKLISDVRALRAHGLPVSVLAFDVGIASSKQQLRRDAVMANHIRAAWLADAMSRVVILTGNVHAKKTYGALFNPRYESVVYLLADLKPLSFLMRSTGGEAWICNSGGCGPQTSSGNPSALQEAAGLTNDPSLLPAFDGYFDVGRTTASLPSLNPRDLK
jgi:hypothetical protein